LRKGKEQSSAHFYLRSESRIIAANNEEEPDI
jgi:hypothetical protein